MAKDEWKNVGKIQGDKGEKGDTGDTGKQGETGDDGKDLKWKDMSTDEQEDLSENIADELKDDETFQDNVKGDKGDDGEQGEKGDTGDTGDKGEDGIDMENGDGYAFIGDEILMVWGNAVKLDNEDGKYLKGLFEFQDDLGYKFKNKDYSVQATINNLSSDALSVTDLQPPYVKAKYGGSVEIGIRNMRDDDFGGDDEVHVDVFVIGEGEVAD